MLSNSGRFRIKASAARSMRRRLLERWNECVRGRDFEPVSEPKPSTAPSPPFRHIGSPEPGP